MSEPSPSFGKSVGHTSGAWVWAGAEANSGYLPFWWQGVFSICRDEGRGEQVRQRMCVREAFK